MALARYLLAVGSMLMALCLTEPSPATPSAVRIIPPQFHGTWCAGDDAEEHRLSIEASEISYYEIGGRVQKVIVKSTRAIVVTGRYIGEGETFMSTDDFTLDRSGRGLTTHERDGSIVRYGRCQF